MEITWKYGWKHFFGHYNFRDLALDSDINQTLFIGIIRNPIEWLDSLYKQLHHIPLDNRISPEALLLNEHYSIDNNNNEIIEDRSIITKEKYKNIFELRKVKNDYLIYHLKKKIKKYILIRYKDLKNNYDEVLSYIENTFNLTRINKNLPFIEIINYKGDKNKILYEKKKIKLKEEIINIIKNNLDKEQESLLGYEL
jgi:hypothetical protein